MYRKLNQKILLFYFTVAVLFIGWSSADAQVNNDDPFTGNYRMADNSEIFIMYTDDLGKGDFDTSGVYSRILDINGAVTNGDVDTTGQMVEPDAFPFIRHDSPMEVMTADLNSDGFDDIVTAWQGIDSTITLMIPQIDPNTFVRTGATYLTVQDLGFPKLNHSVIFHFLTHLNGFLVPLLFYSNPSINFRTSLSL